MQRNHSCNFELSLGWIMNVNTGWISHSFCEPRYFFNIYIMHLQVVWHTRWCFKGTSIFREEELERAFKIVSFEKAIFPFQWKMFLMFSTSWVHNQVPNFVPLYLVIYSPIQNERIYVITLRNCAANGMWPKAYFEITLSKELN